MLKYDILVIKRHIIHDVRVIVIAEVHKIVFCFLFGLPNIHQGLSVFPDDGNLADVCNDQFELVN